MEHLVYKTISFDHDCPLQLYTLEMNTQYEKWQIDI
jgi:hypothetical protein